MRVGFFVGQIQSEELGGGHVFQVSIIEALVRARCSHELYVYYSCDKDLFENTENIKFINIESEDNLIFKKKYKMLNDLALKIKIGLIYFLTIGSESVEMPYIATVWDLAHRVHPYFPEVSTSGWTFENREKDYSKVLPAASRIVIGNEAGVNQICKYYNVDAGKVKTIPMPTPDYVYSLRPDDSILKKHNLEQRKYLFYPAQFWPHKNHIRLLKAAKILKEQDFKIVFTGSDMGNMRYIKQKVEEFELQDTVLFLGFVSKEELIALYKNAFALAFTSLFGPDNIPPLEAMALRCPVIYPKIEGAYEQLRDCALYFDPHCVEELIEQVEKLKITALREELINKAETLAREYHVDNYVKEIFNLLDEFALIRECWCSSEKYIDL